MKKALDFYVEYRTFFFIGLFIVSAVFIIPDIIERRQDDCHIVPTVPFQNKGEPSEPEWPSI